MRQYKTTVGPRQLLLLAQLAPEAAGASRRSDPDTAQSAGRAVRANALEARVLDALRLAPHGLTTEELAFATGLTLVTVSPRLRPLARKGLARDSGQRRKNQSGHAAIVWIAGS